MVNHRPLIFISQKHVATRPIPVKQTNPGGEKSCEGLLQAGQRVQTAFSSNPAGLWSRLSKAAELPEWAEQTNPPHEQSIRR